MPYVNIQVTPAIDREKKRQLVAEVTDTLVRVLGKKPEHIHIVIDEVLEENWGFAGMLTDEFKRQEAPPQDDRPRQAAAPPGPPATD